MWKFLIVFLSISGLMMSYSFAHIVLSEPKAVAGSYYKATLRVGHGCGEEATKAIIVEIPLAFQGAKPQPKTGWYVGVKKQKLASPYHNHGKVILEDVAQIRWEALSPEFYLPNDQFDEFSFFTRLSDQTGPVWVKITQQCTKGVNEWVQIPATGVSLKGLKNPAALLEVAPNQESHRH